MTPYRDSAVPRSTILRSAGQTGVLLACVGLLSLICAGLTIAALGDSTSDPFIPAMGALLAGSGALGVLFGKVLAGSGSASCPLCGARIHEVERTGRVEGILCGHCGRFLCGAAGKLEPMDEGTVADTPIFGAVVATDFEWPPGCVVCGAPATQDIPVYNSDAEARDVGLSVVGLAMVATVGAGFWMHGKRSALNVPHCAGHDDGAAVGEGGPTGFMLLFRSYPYQRAFCELNRTHAIESSQTGRSEGSDSASSAQISRARTAAPASRPGAAGNADSDVRDHDDVASGRKSLEERSRNDR